MLESEKHEAANRKLSASARARIAAAARKRWQKFRGTLAQVKRPPRALAQVNIPPGSRLCDKLIENIGRQFRDDEARFVRQVQTSFANARVRKLTETDLGLMAGRGNAYNCWKPLDLWRDFPPDDYYFWLYVAWELRRRKWRYPQFVAGITDFHLIEPAMKQWERHKAIEQWNNWFREFDGRAPVSESGALELRLAVGVEEARLQWRSDANAGFADLKQAQARRIAEQFEKGALAIAPNSLPFWGAAYRPWRHESWWLFRYANATAHPGLNRLLRMPLAPDRVVTDDGQPLARVAEPLRLNLRSPENGDGSYELAVGTSDGSPPPKILCALAGEPTLYLTKRGLFTGPPADALNTELPKNIPAPALETAAGVRFLHTAGIPLPDRLSQRVRTVPVSVTISCALRSVSASSQIEDIVLCIAAKAPGMKSERFTPKGWKVEGGNKTRGNSEPADGIIVVHDRAAQKYFPRAIESLELKWQDYSGEWTLRLIKKRPELFVSWLQSLPPEIDVLLDRELDTLREAPVSSNVSLDVVEAGIDWFDLKVALKVSDTRLTPQELKLLLNARGGYVRLEKRGWRRLQFSLTPEDDEQLARLGIDARDFSAEPQRFHALQLADDAAKKFLAPERVKEIQRRASELKTRVAPPLPSTIRAEMRPYQTEGFHFLAYLASNRFGGVLADDMGLGKTLQTLAWVAWLRETTLNAQPPTLNSSLVVCPKSVMDNWQAEAERFYPNLRVRLWRGEPAAELSAARKDYDLLVINYTQLRSLSPDIASAPWLAAILDEAQYIKNPDSQTAQAARALKAEHRLALTGTPIENRLLDLWSIFGFAMAGALGNRAHFHRRFDTKDDPLARRRLAARVRPFLLRRTKAQVERDLPDRVEEDLLCEMEGEQKTLYRAELKRARQLILGLRTNEQLNKERFNILTSLLRLRQICCHPALVDARLREAESAKVSALEDLLEPLIEGGHKALVFSQFVTMLDLLREKVKQRGWPHFYLAGETENRGELVREFQSAKDGAVFLISLKAGGLGLNLTAASYVVLFDPWWNPAVENQAIDRTHRIGQTSKVIAYRLLIRESIEQKIRALQKRKAALADDVLGEERFAQSLTLEDLRFLFAEQTGDSMSATA
jgi:superfamily II DNA or RNA helicase